MRATGARTDERPRRKRGPDFSGSAGKGESENPRGVQSADALLIHTRHFLLVTFLCASKEKLPGPQGRKPCTANAETQDPRLRGDDRHRPSR